MSRTLLTVGALGVLSSVAYADPDSTPQPRAATAEVDVVAGSARGVAQSYLVLPSGGELGADLKLVTADSFAGMPLKFSDLGLFTLHGRYAVTRRIEVAADTTLVPKQPSYSDEKVWQSASAAMRVGLGASHALAVSVAGGHLLDHTGAWTESALMIERRKPLTEYMSFDLRGGADLITLVADDSSAHVGELSVQAATHFRDPTGHTGAWLGISYAVPIAHGGDDPTTGLAVDPQPRLDLHIGFVLAPVDDWDVYVDGAVIDRGDLSNPATRLPILDGGFDQRQLTFGVVRHFQPNRHHHDPDRDSGMVLGQR